MPGTCFIDFSPQLSAAPDVWSASMPSFDDCRQTHHRTAGCDRLPVPVNGRFGEVQFRSAVERCEITLSQAQMSASISRCQAAASYEPTLETSVFEAAARLTNSPPGAAGGHRDLLTGQWLAYGESDSHALILRLAGAKPEGRKLSCEANYPCESNSTFPSHAPEVIDECPQHWTRTSTPVCSYPSETRRRFSRRLDVGGHRD